MDLFGELDRSNRNDLEPGGELLMGENRNPLSTHPDEITEVGP
jgi:hypothetical protein